MHFASEISPLATIGSFIIALLFFVDRCFPQLRPEIMKKGSQLRRWAWPMIFLAISLGSGITWYVTSHETHRGSLEPRYVDYNKDQMISIGPTNHVLVLFMEIYNSGRPTVVRDWLLRIKGVDEEKTVVFGYAQRDLSQTMKASNPVNSFTVDNYIFDKVRTTPIPNGGMENGFIMFQILGVDEKWLHAAGTAYQVTFSNVYGNYYTNDFYWPLPKPQSN